MIDPDNWCPQERAPTERTVFIAGDVLVGREVQVGAYGGASPHHIAVPGDAWIDGAGAAAAIGARAGGVAPVLLADVGDDPEGALCIERLDAIGINTEHICVQPGMVTGSMLSCWLPTAEESVRITVPAATRAGGPSAPTIERDALEAKSVLERGGPGDIVLINGLALARGRGLEYELTYARREEEMPVIVDLHPFLPFAVGTPLSAKGAPSAIDPKLFEEALLAVVDTEGAGLIAESGALVPSLVVLAGAHGATWDGDVRHLPEAVEAAGGHYDRWAPFDPTSTWAHHAFCGRLAAELAGGAGRQEALDAALLTWWQHAQTANDDAFPGRRLSPPVPPRGAGLRR